MQIKKNGARRIRNLGRGLICEANISLNVVQCQERVFYLGSLRYSSPGLRCRGKEFPSGRKRSSGAGDTRSPKACGKGITDVVP